MYTKLQVRIKTVLKKECNDQKRECLFFQRFKWQLQKNDAYYFDYDFLKLKAIMRFGQWTTLSGKSTQLLILKGRFRIQSLLGATRKWQRMKFL
jgi:hypothetical protein